MERKRIDWTPDVPDNSGWKDRHAEPFTFYCGRCSGVTAQSRAIASLERDAGETKEG